MESGNDNIDMELPVKDDGLWLHRPDAHPQFMNLGDPERAFQLFTDRMAQFALGQAVE